MDGPLKIVCSTGRQVLLCAPRLRLDNIKELLLRCARPQTPLITPMVAVFALGFRLGGP